MSLSTSQLTQLHRRQQLALRKATVAEMESLWPALDWQSLDTTYPRFAATVAEMVARNRNTSAGLASAYMRAFRVASGLSGDLRVITPDALPLDQFRTSLRVTSVVAAKSAAAAGTPAEVAMGAALVQATGAMSRLVLDAGRDTITATSVSDPASRGWQRVGSGMDCAFCQMLIDRGAVYSEEGVNFASHDHCNCSAEPAYGGDRVSVGAYKRSERNITDADRARVRDYLANNKVG